MVEDAHRARAALLTLRLVLAVVGKREGTDAELELEPLEARASAEGVTFVFPELVCGLLERGGDGSSDQVWTERRVGEVVDARLYDRAGRLLYRAWWSCGVSVPATVARHVLRLRPVGTPALN